MTVQAHDQDNPAQEKESVQDEDDEEPLELEVVDAVDSAGTMAARNGTLTVRRTAGPAARQDSAGQDSEDVEDDDEEVGESRLERVALVERLDPKLALKEAASRQEAPGRAKVTVFRRERGGPGGMDRLRGLRAGDHYRT